MKTDASTEYLVPDSIWEIEGQRGLTFRIAADEDGYYTYDSVRALPKVVEHDGRLYRRTGWNSDTGEAYYRMTRRSELARPFSPDPN